MAGSPGPPPKNRLSYKIHRGTGTEAARVAAHTFSEPPWRQPMGKLMVSSVNSHTNSTRIGWHLWDIDLRFALGLPPWWCICKQSCRAWSCSKTRTPEAGSRNPESETWNLEPETRNLELGIRDPEPGTRNPKPRTRNPKPETRNQAGPTLQPRSSPHTHSV